MYRPNRHFMKQLRALDPNLGCAFNRDTQKFNVTYQRVVGKPIPILPVVSESGGFRQPDRRELLTLGEGDMTRGDGVKGRLQRATKYMTDYRKKAEVDGRDNIRNMTKDNKNQLSRVFSNAAGSGKNNATFRRIEPKTRGEVFK